MRIAVIANTSWYVWNFRSNLLAALAAKGHETIVIAPPDEYSSRIVAAGHAFEPVPMSAGGMNPLVESVVVARLLRALRRRRVEVVLSNTPKGNLYGGIASMIAGLHFVPNVSGLGRVFVRATPLTAMVKLAYRIVFARARRIMFQNREDMRHFIDVGIVRSELSERIPGSGVDLQRFVRLPLPSQDGAPVTFLMSCRMLWQKGVREYVEAARIVRARLPGVRFKLLGPLSPDNPGRVPAEAISAWQEQGIVSYLGATDDVRPFIAAADCAVLPSYYGEGVPRTLLEAAAMGRPVITTDRPGCRDTVDDGKTGYLVQREDAKDLAEKMLRFATLDNDARQRMALAARVKIEREFR